MSVGLVSVDCAFEIVEVLGLPLVQDTGDANWETTHVTWWLWEFWDLRFKVWNLGSRVSGSRWRLSMRERERERERGGGCP